MLTEARTLVDVLRNRAQSREGSKGFTFLVDGEGVEERLDYAELERRARSLAAQLSMRVPYGERAVLVFDAGLDYVRALFACFQAGVVAVPAYPPNPLRPEAGLAQIERVVIDSGAVAVMGSTGLLTRLRGLIADAPWAPILQWIDVNDASGDCVSSLPEVDAEDIAIIQYTSGSTSDPKGVVVTHRNLVHNSRNIREAFGLSENSSGVSWLPPHHDMGLMGGIIQPMCVGMDMVLFSPQLFTRRPLTFLEAISRFQLTGGGGPNFGYELLTRRVPESAKAKLDLRSWNLAFCGAEPVRTATLDAFTAAFAVCGFRREAFLPCYGLAEATLIVTASEVGQTPRSLSIDAEALGAGRVLRSENPEQGKAFVSCGRPPGEMRVIVVDPDSLARQPEDRAGEIWVKGRNVARGYWRAPEATAAAFDATLDTGESGFLRTGDLGFIHEGDLFITGRLKDLIIIRGRNLHPADIESTVEHSHPAVRPGRSAAFSAEIDGEERLIVVCEVGRKVLLDSAPVKDAVRVAVAGAHGIAPHEIVLLEPSRLPRTSSGKPRRTLARKRFMSGTLGLQVESEAAE
ncbi:MAG: fatty acyl-AMP ligase [Vicinamibacteria bacterium]|nr:fatty acyl-AMP ligase [Vicinamibacteria bacterium]